MQWEFVVALAVALPIILFPAAFIWYMNIGGIYHAIKETRKRKGAQFNDADMIAKAEQFKVVKTTTRRIENEPVKVIN